MKLRLSKVEALRPQAENFVDKHFKHKIEAAIGPMGILHALKRIEAERAGSALIDDDEDRAAILRKASEQDEAIAQLDAQRRSAKAAIRSATSTQEIEAVLADLP